MLAHRVEIDQRPAILLPEQVVALEVTMADALTDQFGKQVIQRRQLGLRCITAFHVRRKALDDVRPRQMLGDEIGTTAQPEKTFLQKRQRLGRGDAKERQAIAFAPGMPGPARAPEALEPVCDPLML